ncbi:MAG: biotin/lipoyl-binding protein, partial [Gemmatimonadaceae bacterium]|nr:biotin/lipoyl-binding protein [Gemmatimonadaceae bacterium]
MHSYFRALLLLASLATMSCGNADAHVDATGTVEFTNVDVAPIQTARLLRLDVAEGQTVHVGDTIAVLNSSALPFETRELEAALGQAAA